MASWHDTKRCSAFVRSILWRFSPLHTLVMRSLQEVSTPESSWGIIDAKSDMPIGWIVTYVINQRHGGPSSGYTSSGFYGGNVPNQTGFMPIVLIIFSQG